MWSGKLHRAGGQTGFGIQDSGEGIKSIHFLPSADGLALQDSGFRIRDSGDRTQESGQRGDDSAFSAGPKCEEKRLVDAMLFLAA